MNYSIKLYVTSDFTSVARSRQANAAIQVVNQAAQADIRATTAPVFEPDPLRPTKFGVALAAVFEAPPPISVPPPNPGPIGVKMINSYYITYYLLYVIRKQ